MEWHFSNDTPIYTQIMDRIKLAIASGQLLPGGHMATVRELAQEAGVNPNTMQRALAELEREGLLYTNRTSGRYVTDDVRAVDGVKKSMAKGYIRSFTENMGGLGYSREEIFALLREDDKEDEQ